MLYNNVGSFRVTRTISPRGEGSLRGFGGTGGEEDEARSGLGNGFEEDLVLRQIESAAMEVEVKHTETNSGQGKCIEVYKASNI